MGPTLLGWVLAVLAVAPSLAWVLLDRRVWPFDQAWYGEVAAQLIGTLLLQPTAWLSEMVTAIPSKPPLLPWIGQFFVPLSPFTSGIDGALLISVVMAQCLTLVCVHGLVRSLALGSNFWPVTATMATASAPLFVGMSHQYLVEAFQTATVLLSFLLAYRAKDLPILRATLLLILVITTGMLAKTTTPLYAGLAWAYTAIDIVLRLRRGALIDWRDPGAIILILPTSVLAALGLAWYVKNSAAVLSHMRNSSVAEIATHYGTVGTLATKLPFWISAVGDATTILPFGGPVLLALCAIGGVRAITELQRGIHRRRAMFMLLILVHIFIVLVSLSLQINEETRFLSCQVPLIAICAVYGLSWPSARIVGAIAASLAALQFGAVAADALALGPHMSRSTWLLPRVQDPSDRLTIEILEGRTCPSDLANRYVVVGVEYPRLNGNSLAMYSARARVSRSWRCNYTSFGYAETDLLRAFERVESLNASYLILPIESKLPADGADFLNMFVTSAYKFVSSSNRYVREGTPVGDFEVWRRLD